MEDQIAQALVASMSADETTRVNAETQLTQGGTQLGFGLALTRVALNQQTPYGTRQLAAVVLKKYIKEHWQEGEGRFFPPQTSDEEKAAIRELLPVGLSDPIGKIRTACGMAIATICTWDWPHAWPALTGLLIGALRDRASEDAVTGALRCLAMIAGDLEETQVPETVPVLFPELLALVDAPAASPGVKRRALAVMHSVLMTLGMMSGARQRAVRDLMAPLLPGWIDAFARIVDPAHPPGASDAAGCGLVLETLRCLTQVTQYFSKTAGDSLLVPLGRVAALFHAMAPAYRAGFVESADEEDSERDSDGETLSMETVTSQTIELIMTLVEHPRLSATLANALEDVAYQAIGYMCMTRAQEEAWRDDPNQYVADEDDDVSTVRAMCGILLDELCDRFEAAALKALSSAARRRLAESEAARAGGNPHWWKTREASMLAVGVVADFAVEADAAAKEKGAGAGGAPSAFDVNAFLASVLERELAEGERANEHAGNAFLRGRALWVAAKLAPAAPPSSAAAVLRAAVGSLAPSAEAPLRVGACRALAQYVPAAPKDALRPLLGPMYQGLGGLLEAHERNAQAEAQVARARKGAGANVAATSSFPGDDSDDDSLHLVLEAMLVVVKADDEAAAAWSHALAPATLRLWSARVADPLLSASARDVLEALANVPACLPPLLELAVPTLAGVARNPETQPPTLVESALDLLCVLLRPAPCGGEEARACHAACFGAVARLAATSDDVGVLQSAAECLRAFLRSGGEASLRWGADGAGGGDVLRAYLDAAARLLSPDTEEGASVFAAPLLGQMLRRLPNQMAPVLGEVVTAVVRRARHAEQPNLVAALVPVLARLAHADADALVAMLAASPAPPLGGARGAREGEDGIPPAATALEAAMRCWVGFQGDVQGAFDIKITVTALASLLASERSAPALGAVVVRGEPVVADVGDVPRTRARTRAAGPERFHPTPAPAAMLALLADAVLETREAAALGDDDDEWEDEDEEDDDGEGEGASGGGAGRAGGLFGGDLLERLMEKGVDDAEDDDVDELEDPLYSIDVESFVAGALRSAHAAGRLAPLAANLDRRRQQALMALLA